MHNLLKKSSVVLVVEPVSSIRNTIRKVFSEFGYNDVLMAETPSEAFSMMLNSQVDWVFCGLFPTENTTGVHLLRAAVELPDFRHVRFSALINEDDMKHLPFLFSLGLFSFHVKPMTFDSLTADLTSLMSKLEDLDNEQDFTAALLRDYLHSTKNYKVLSEMEAGLFETVSQTPFQLSKYIESLFLGGHKLKATTLLYSNLGEDKEKDEILKPLLKEYIGVSELSSAEPSTLIQTCLVVDPDDSSVVQVKNVLEKLGVKEVLTINDVKEACDLLPKRKDIDLVITEWKLRSITGEAFIQHVRDHDHPITPIVVYSSLVPDEYSKFFNEVGQVEVINKPCQEGQFKQLLSDVIKKFRFPNSSQDYEEKIRSLLAAGDVKGAKNLFSKYKKMPSTDAAGIILMEAFFDFSAGEYEKAKTKIMQAGGHGPLNHIGLSLLGKVLLN